MSIDKIRNIGLDKLVTQVYDFDSLTTDELLCKFAQKINIVIEHFNYLDKQFQNNKENMDLKLEYLLGEGLEKEVAKALLKKIEDGSIIDFITGSRKINVVNYGAKGDGITDDSDIITSIINKYTDNNKFQTIEFPQGYTFNIPKGINLINKKNLLLTGGGRLINGSINIQGDSDSDPLFITIKDLFIEQVTDYEYHPKTNPAITLAKCSRISIYDNTFKNTGKSIHYKLIGTESHQQISKILIQRNVFENVDYCLTNDITISDFYLSGDTTFSNNHVNLAWTSTLDLRGCDGLMFNGNTIFTPRHSLTQDMIKLEKFNYIRIENNQLFEAGLCTVKAKNGENLNIINNSIAYGGQNALSAGIDILDCVMVSVSGNLIERCTNYGIKIIKGDNYCSFVSVTNNIVRDIGVNPFYRGTNLSSANKTPIYLGTGITRNLVDGNVSDLPNVGIYNNGNNVYDDVFQKNLDFDTKVDKSASNYFAQVNNLGLSETNTLINFMVNKGVSKFPSFYDDGRNLIVDDTGEARFINYISTQEQTNFNIVSYVCNDGDIRNKFTQHKLYQIF